MKTTTDILLVEDNVFLAEAMREKLGLFDEFNLLDVAQDENQLRTALDAYSPDLILMDIELPGKNGIELTQIVRREYPQVKKIIIVTVFEDDELVFDAIQAGVDGYLVKDTNAEELRRGIHNTMNNGAAMSPNIAAKALRLLRNPRIVKGSEAHNLSEREIEVLQHLKSGKTYKSIAQLLYLSEGTIRKHVENIYKKLQAHNKLEAVSIAERRNII